MKEPTQQVQNSPDALLRELGTQLRDTWQRVFAEDAAGIQRPTRLARQWGLEQTLCTRLFQALKAEDPLVVLQRLPATTGLSGILEVAREKGVREELLSETETAVSRLQNVIEQLGGSKSTLDTLASRNSAHSRERLERGAKQQVYRGAANLYGLHARTSVVQVWVFPNREDPNWCDELVVHGFHGLLRLRPEQPALLGVRQTLHEDREGVIQALHREEFDDTGYATALPEFCSDPFPEIDLRFEEGKLLYLLREQVSGLPRKVDVFFASVERKGEPKFSTPEHKRARWAFVPHTPSQHVVFDVFLHSELWRGLEPEHLVLRSGDPRSEDLSAHSLDRLDVVENLQSLGSSDAAIASEEYPRMEELVTRVRGRMGWGAGDFRLYRMSIRYPVVDLWYSIQLGLPERPR